MSEPKPENEPEEREVELTTAAGEAPGEQQTEPAATADVGPEEPLPKLQHPGRRYLPIVILAVVALLVGSLLNRVVASYRGVVLEVRDEQMLLAYANKAPEWVESMDVAPGRILEKQGGAWSPAPVAPDIGDRMLLQLYERYSRVYTGTVTELLPPGPAGSAAVVETDRGERVVIKLFAEHLIDAAVGDRVEKQANTWDPVITEKARVIHSPVIVPPPGVVPTPPGAPAKASSPGVPPAFLPPPAPGSPSAAPPAAPLVPPAVPSSPAPGSPPAAPLVPPAVPPPPAPGSPPAASPVPVAPAPPAPAAP
jgi:hypothetical protein